MSQGYDSRTGKFLAMVATCMAPISGDRMSHLMSNPAELRRALYAVMPPLKPTGLRLDVDLGTYQGLGVHLRQRHFADRALVRFINSNPSKDGDDIEHDIAHNEIPLETTFRRCIIEVHSVQNLGFEEETKTDYVLERAELVGLKPAPVEAMFFIGHKHYKVIPESTLSQLVTMHRYAGVGAFKYCVLRTDKSSGGGVTIGNYWFGETVKPNTQIVFEKIAA